jgi:hypothetical protein
MMDLNEENEKLRAKISDLNSELTDSFNRQSDLLRVSTNVSKERDGLWAEKFKLQNSLIRDQHKLCEILGVNYSSVYICIILCLFISKLQSTFFKWCVFFLRTIRQFLL